MTKKEMKIEEKRKIVMAHRLKDMRWAANVVQEAFPDRYVSVGCDIDRYTHDDSEELIRKIYVEDTGELFKEMGSTVGLYNSIEGDTWGEIVDHFLELAEWMKGNKK